MLGIVFFLLVPSEIQVAVVRRRLCIAYTLWFFAIGIAASSVQENTFAALVCL